MKRLDHIKIFLSDGKPHKLKDIAKHVVSSGYIGSPTSNYIAVYQLLRDHPELFVKSRYGEYMLKNTIKQWIKLDSAFIIDEIDSVLRMKSYQTPAQIWRKLLVKGIQITYNMTQYYLGCHFSSDQYARYFVEK